MSNYYVRKTGSDSNSGTSSSSAFLTINKALTTCLAGDTIYVGAGTYSDQIQNMTKANVTIIGDTNGSNTGDSGLVIVSQTTINQFTGCSGTNFTVKNIINSCNGYSLYLSNNTAKMINCIFCGVNGGTTSGASYNGYMYNCIVIGTYAFANNMGAPQKVANSILIGTCESGMNVNFQNCYTLSAGSDVFVNKSGNNYRVSSTYEANVKNTGVYITNVPTTDIVGTARQTPPWIGAYDTYPNYPPTLNSPIKTFINNNLQMQLSATSVSDPDGNTVKYQVSVKKPDNSVVIKRAYDSSFQTSPFTFSTITFDASEFDVGVNTIIVDVMDNQSPAGTYQWSTTLTKTNTLKLLIQDGVKWKYINGSNLVSALTNYTTAIDSDKVNAFLSFGMGNNLSSIASAMNQVENSTVSVVVYKFGLLS